ncbi:MAG TPA: hypothetical protein VEU29_06135 [Actinomycetota bacterium]|nr:hypothetical protein [Actinomycetota bacterium]
MKILRVIALAAALSLTLSACGGDDADDSADATSAAEETAAQDAGAGDAQAFCENVVAAETAVLQASTGGDPSAVEDLLAAAEEAAPAELEEQMGVVGATVREALDKQDDAAFQSEEFSQSEEEIDEWVADNCGYERIDVAAVDYAFEGVPETLPAGTVTFGFSNEGEEVHEMLILRYKDPATTIEDLMKLSDKEAQSKIDFLGASFGPPGASDLEPKELTPGKYALVCFVPVGSTSPKAARKADGPPHVARGMSAEFTVE